MISKQNNKKQGNPPAMATTNRGRNRWVPGILMLIVLSAALFMLWPDRNTTPPANPSPSSAPVSTSTKRDNVGGYERLVGRWLRSDGGYFIEIRGAAADGKLDAGYFNPKPIHVGNAGWLKQNDKIVVMVELQDVNYPGSTYTLELHNTEDRMTGTYYQAVEKANYEVEFVRQQ